MLFQIQSSEDLAKNVVNPPVVGILDTQEFADFFWFNNVSLKIRLPSCKKRSQKDKQNYHTMGVGKTTWMTVLSISADSLIKFLLIEVCALTFAQLIQHAGEQNTWHN